jgi:hypothetical protein
MFDALLDDLLGDLVTLEKDLATAVTRIVATARTRLEGAVADMTMERVKGLSEVASERSTALAEVYICIHAHSHTYTHTCTDTYAHT